MLKKIENKDKGKDKNSTFLTFKQKHGLNFSEELGKARQVAEFGIKNKTISSKDVSHFGLKSMISNQVLRKYSKNKKCRKISSVNLGIPKQGIKYDSKTVYIPCLKFSFIPNFHKEIVDIKYIEISKDYIHCVCEVKNQDLVKQKDFIGVDLNSTGHICVAAIPKTGKVLKLGKKAPHIRKKYANIRSKLQSKKRFRRLKQLKNREARITKDLNHKISKDIVSFAKTNDCGIKLENLKGIRKNGKKDNKGKKNKKRNHNLNTWAFYQLRNMIEYKALLAGVEVKDIAPHYTSQKCSKCGLIGERNGKIFKSPNFGVEHADVNAAFNIALTPVQLVEERVSIKG